MKPYLLAFILAIIGLWTDGLPHVVQAAPVPLRDLFAPGASLTQGDKLFDHFSLLTSDLPDPTVLITGVDAGGSHGFLITGPISDGEGEAFQTIFTYRVTVLNPNLQIHGVATLMDLLVPNGTGSLTLLSSFFGDAALTSNLGNSGVGFPGPPSLSSIQLSQDGQALFVRSVFSEEGPISGSLSITTTFFQTPVPMPPAVALFGSGLLGPVGLRYLSRQLLSWRQKNDGLA